MQELSTGNPVVDRISKLSFRGNLIPETWYHHIVYRTERGHYANYLAIAILGDILSWYCWRELYDAESGEITGVEQRFKADMLQRSYKSLCRKFCCSDKQAREAVALLKSLRLIEVELRIIEFPDGTKLANVMFIKPVVEEVERITYTSASVRDQSRVDPSPRNGGHPPLPEMGDITHIPNVHTNHVSLQKHETAPPALSPSPPQPPRLVPKKPIPPKPVESKSSNPSEESSLIWDAITELCQLAPSFPPGRLGNCVKALKKNKPLPSKEDFEKFARWWEDVHWKGKQGKLPSPEEVCSNWGEAMRWDEPQIQLSPGTSLMLTHSKPALPANFKLQDLMIEHACEQKLDHELAQRAAQRRAAKPIPKGY